MKFNSLRTRVRMRSGTRNHSMTKLQHVLGMAQWLELKLRFAFELLENETIDRSVVSNNESHKHGLNVSCILPDARPT